MLDMFLLCEWSKTTMLVNMLNQQLNGQETRVEVFTYGMTSKQGLGFILLVWHRLIPESFIDSLVKNDDILDFGTFDTLKDEQTGDTQP